MKLVLWSSRILVYLIEILDWLFWTKQKICYFTVNYGTHAILWKVIDCDILGDILQMYVGLISSPHDYISGQGDLLKMRIYLIGPISKHQNDFPYKHIDLHNVLIKPFLCASSGQIQHNGISGYRISRRGAWTPAVKFRKICMSKWKNLDPWGGVGRARPL